MLDKLVCDPLVSVVALTVVPELEELLSVVVLREVRVSDVPVRVVPVVRDMVVSVKLLKLDVLEAVVLVPDRLVTVVVAVSELLVIVEKVVRDVLVSEIVLMPEVLVRVALLLVRETVVEVVPLVCEVPVWDSLVAVAVNVNVVVLTNEPLDSVTVPVGVLDIVIVSLAVVSVTVYSPPATSEHALVVVSAIMMSSMSPKQ